MANLLIMAFISSAICMMPIGVQALQSSIPDAPQNQSPSTDKPELPVFDAQSVDDIVMGVDSAPVTIVEYSSLNCISCAAFHLTVLPEIRRKYIDTGKVRFIFRHYPLDERAAEIAAIISCAPKIKQYGLLSRLFDQQLAWMHLEAPAPKLAEITGIPIDVCKAAMTSKQLTDAVFEKRWLADKKIAIIGTPTFTLNDEIIDVVPTLENLEPYLQTKPVKQIHKKAVNPHKRIIK